MLFLRNKPGWFCDGPSRRELLSIGSLGLLGISLPDVLAWQAQASKSGHRSGTAQSVILIHLQGSPSHIDLWDPKPDAPVEIRGEFKTIKTRVPGILLSETLPLLAQEADKFALIRTMSVKPKGLTNHGSAIYMLMTGHDPSNFSPTGLAVPPSREDLPSVGATAVRYRPADPGMLGYVAVCGPVIEAAVSGLGQGAGLLGRAYDPFAMYDDPTKPLRTEALALPPDVTLGRMRARYDLRTAFASRQRLGPDDFESYYSKALSLVATGSAERSFRLDMEPQPLREKYGMTRFGQSCLLARRLIEAGTRFVQVTWPAGSDTEPEAGPDGSWDTHRNNFPMLRDWRCPVFDRAASALLADLADRSLLSHTLVVAIGEFGRSPRLGSPTTNNVGPGGRDHWPSCYTCLIAGAGVRGGQVYGESDRYAAYPKSNPVHPYDLIMTIYHALGIPPDTEYKDSQDRPRRLVDQGQPVLGLF
jgi:hypothetical protein